MTSQSVYSLILNLIGLDWHTVWYIQYFRWPVVEWLKTKKRKPMKSMMRIQLKREMNLIETNHHINIASDHPVSSNDSFKSFLNAEGFNMVLALLQLCEAP